MVFWNLVSDFFGIGHHFFLYADRRVDQCWSPLSNLSLWCSIKESIFHASSGILFFEKSVQILLSSLFAPYQLCQSRIVLSLFLLSKLSEKPFYTVRPIHWILT